MKTFHYANTKGTKTTMTVAELRDALANVPGELPVFATWEGVYAPFRIDNFARLMYDGCIPEDACEILEIDVEDY
jgi:hypothetical protein